MDWVVYGALALGVLAVLAAASFVVVRCLQAWRDFKRFRRQLARELARLAETAELTAETAERLTDQPELEASTRRLRGTLARFAVLRAAVDETAGAVGRVTAVYPRK
ncbi:MAG TPA: hypothetical protein VFA30_02360 [Gaiellaceae bacterium]|nr:hypothetical protein [Gaiellaceae bacterium]